jgi:hypothetical protein
MHDDHHLEVEARREIRRESSEVFDRIAFAMRALRLLRPDMTVAVYPRARSLEVQRGRDLSRGEDAVWAMVGVPPDASREQIALTIAELDGARSQSLLVDLLVAADARETPLD